MSTEQVSDQSESVTSHVAEFERPSDRDVTFSVSGKSPKMEDPFFKNFVKKNFFGQNLLLGLKKKMFEYGGPTDPNFRHRP